LLFPRDGARHFGVHLKVNQSINFVPLRETLHHAGLVLPDALNEIAGNADVQRAAWLAGEDVDGGLFEHEQIFARTILPDDGDAQMDPRAREDDG
jgi:hypothetical protein